MNLILLHATVILRLVELESQEAFELCALSSAEPL